MGWAYSMHGWKTAYKYLVTTPLERLRISDSRGVRISVGNAGYTKSRDSVKSTGYPLHFASFPFTSRPLRQRVPSHFKWSLPLLRLCLSSAL